MTNNLAATYIYRRMIADAIRWYNLELRKIFQAYGSVIPPSAECMGAMVNAWGTCRVMFSKADQVLNSNRGD